MNNTELANLDGLRTVAIVTVLIDHLVPTLHYQLGFGSPMLLALTAHIGQAGVLAFFVHTSLVLMFSLERLAEKSSSIALGFYIRRFFRIYPLSWVVIACALVFGLPSNTWRTPEIMSPQIVMANLLLVQNVFTKKQVIQPLWSLAYEAQMYIVLPALYYLARRRLGGAYIFMVTALFCIFGFWLASKTGHLNMAAYVPCFLAGVFCFATRKYVPRVLPAQFWLVTVVSLVAVYSWVHRAEPEPVYWMGWIYCFVLAILINLFSDSSFVGLNWVTHRIAKYSYGLYLFHVPVLYLIFSVFQVKDPFVASAILFSLTLVVSVLAYHFLEEPFIELGRRFGGGR